MISAATNVRNDIAHFLANRNKNAYDNVIVNKGKKLSVLIPFSNEGEEVENGAPDKPCGGLSKC